MYSIYRITRVTIEALEPDEKATVDRDVRPNVVLLLAVEGKKDGEREVRCSLSVLYIA